MEQMFLPEIEQHAGGGPWAEAIRQMREANVPVPQIMHLFAYKPERTAHLAQFTQHVMRGASPLPPGMRELIAAFTSRRNACPF
jgi:alkylhydroperoxidase family enzyme